MCILLKDTCTVRQRQSLDSHRTHAIGVACVRRSDYMAFQNCRRIGRRPTIQAVRIKMAVLLYRVFVICGVKFLLRYDPSDY